MILLLVIEYFSVAFLYVFLPLIRFDIRLLYLSSLFYFLIYCSFLHFNMMSFIKMSTHALRSYFLNYLAIHLCSIAPAAMKVYSALGALVGPTVASAEILLA